MGTLRVCGTSSLYDALVYIRVKSISRSLVTILLLLSTDVHFISKKKKDALFYSTLWFLSSLCLSLSAMIAFRVFTAFANVAQKRSGASVTVVTKRPLYSQMLFLNISSHKCRQILWPRQILIKRSTWFAACCESFCLSGGTDFLFQINK